MINKLVAQVFSKHLPSHYLVSLTMYHLFVFTIIFVASLADAQENNSTIVNITTTFLTKNVTNLHNNNNTDSNNSTSIPTTRIAGARPFGQIKSLNTLIVHFVKQPNRTMVENVSSPSETSTIDPRAAQCTDGQTFWNGTGCHSCTRQCPNGAYMTRRCLQGSDMECQCHKGAYLSADGQCKTCSECPSGWGKFILFLLFN